MMVIIILAAAVILSIANNNPIKNANKAAFVNDIATMREELLIYIKNRNMETLGDYDETSLYATSSYLYENGEQQLNKSVVDVLPSIKSKYLDKIEINKGEIEYVDMDDIESLNWANEIIKGEESNLEKAEADGNEITFETTKKENSEVIENLRLYGNTIENKSVGDKCKNLFNMMNAVNGTTILDNGDGTITVTDYPTDTKKLSTLAPDLKVGDTVTFSLKTTGYSSIYLSNSNTYFHNEGKYTITQEMLDSTVCIYRQTADQGGGSAIISGIQIEYGDTATEYEPYDGEHIGKYKIPITVSGKNLFDISKVTTFLGADYKTNRGNYSSISDGIITSKIGVYSASAPLYDSKVSLPAGTYTVSADFMADKDSGTKGITIGICFTNLAKTNVSYHSISDYRVWERKSHTFTLDEETDIAIITQGTGVKDDYMNLNVKIKNIQLENEKKFTDYEPYYNKTYDIYLDEPLRKLDDAVDYIDFKRGIVVRNIKEIDGELTKLDTPEVKEIDLPSVFTISGTNIINIGTSVTPSNIKAIYNK